MKKLMILFCLFGFAAFGLHAQCASWEGSPDLQKGKESHSVYKNLMKSEDYKGALEYWEEAYKIAPAADGKRVSHWSDGASILSKLYADASDADKPALAKRILGLLDEGIACAKDGGLQLKDAKGDVNYLYGQMAYDLFYTVPTSYSLLLPRLKEGMTFGGNKASYSLMVPAAYMAVAQYKDEKIDAEEARWWYDQLSALGEANKEDETFGAYYNDAFANVASKFSEIENEIFDCNYFKEKLRPKYEADPDNPEVLKSIIAKLKSRSCPESDPMLSELEGKWAKYAAAENAKMQAEYEANNPGVMASKLYKEGKYAEAIAKYEEAISKEADPQKQAEYKLGIASIQFRKLKSYGAARKSALDAASMKGNWGAPYMLIGDMYATSARSCGDSWNQRLAILAAIDKYAYARKVDSSVSGEASSRISKYAGSKPSLEDAFSRGKKKGDRVKVGCWIGETVTLRF